LFKIAEVDWHSAKEKLIVIRTDVFIREQHVPPALEWDNLDQSAKHLLASDSSGNAIGCARILSGGTIGRMAVVPEWRRQGVGAALLQAAIRLCSANHWPHIKLSAQTHAIGFYEKHGFSICSDEYPDAGIPHRDMQLHRDVN
jgi:predicted GNAT family N-acyltransferase